MKKYPNIILIAFFIVFTINKNLGLALIIPIYFIYSIKNIKNLIIMVPVSIVSTYIYNKDYLFVIGIYFISVIIYTLMMKKKNSAIIDTTIILILNIISLLLINDEISNILLCIVISFSSSIIFIVLKKLLDNSYKYFKYFELVSFLIAILGSTQIEFNLMYEINITFILCCYVIMYISSSYHIILSFIYSLILSIFLYYISNDLMFLSLSIISIIYSIKNITSSFILVTISSVLGFFYRKYIPIVMIVSVLSIIFELTRIYLIGTIEKSKTTAKVVKNSSLSNLCKSLLSFSMFLEYYQMNDDLLSNNDYNNKIEDGVNKITNNYCTKCHMKKKCSQENSNIKDEIKKIIRICKDKSFSYDSSDLLSVCPYNIEIKKSALVINNNLEYINNSELLKNKIIKTVLSPISNIIKKYAIELSMKKEIDINSFINLKKDIQNGGYSVCFFEVLNNSFDDLLLEIGIRNMDYDMFKNDILNISKDNLPLDVSLSFSKIDKDKTYFKVINKNQINIDYSKSNIASSGISGDNIYINDKDNIFTSLICDGMGKGYNASKESSEIVKMMNDLEDSFISSYLKVEILNTLYYLKKNNETFVTFDYLEINKSQSSATFFKLSGTKTRIIHKDLSIEYIENTSLPLGNENIIESKNTPLKKGDIIIMASDGIFENVIDEEKFDKYLISITHLTCDKMIYQIINYVKNDALLTNDDISVVVIQIF